MTVCRADGCDAPVHIRKRGLCKRCYSAWYREAYPFRHSDLTAADLTQMLEAVTHCPLCDVSLTGKHPEPNAPQIDHIVPINVGGNHERSNVRVICRDCNIRRPKDGRDVPRVGAGGFAQ